MTEATQTRPIAEPTCPGCDNGPPNPGNPECWCDDCALIAEVEKEAGLR